MKLFTSYLLCPYNVMILSLKYSKNHEGSWNVLVKTGKTFLSDFTWEDNFV